MFGIDLADPETLWINVTNIALGIVTLICVLAVGWGVADEVYARLKKRWALTAGAPADDHSFVIPELGLTMADGGKKEEEDEESKK